MGDCSSRNSTDVFVPADFKGIKLVCQSWRNTYSNLFDYSATEVDYEISSLDIEQTCRIVRKSDNKMETAAIEEGDNKDGVMDILMKGQQHVLQACQNQTKSAANALWLVIKSTPSAKYNLKEGDMLRIGKQKVKVKEIILNDSETEQILDVHTKYKLYDNLTSKDSEGQELPEDQDQPVCRFCQDEGDHENPLIAPCKCSGSSKYIHLKCIQIWFEKTVDPRTINAAIVLNWKPLVCEICSQNLPFKVYLDDKKYFSVNIPRPKAPYIVLNPIVNGKTKQYYLISFSQKSALTIGRKREADIVMDGCTSISRFHTLIEYYMIQNKPRFLVSDNNSKFGTLVLLKQHLTLQPRFSGLSIQSDGSVLTFLTAHPRNRKTWQQNDDLNQSQSHSQSQ